MRTLDSGSDSGEGDSANDSEAYEDEEDEKERRNARKRARTEAVEGLEWAKSGRVAAWSYLQNFGFGRSELWRNNRAFKNKSVESILAFECGILAQLCKWANETAPSTENAEEKQKDIDSRLGEKVVALMHSQLEKVTGKEALEPKMLLKHVKIDASLCDESFATSVRSKAARLLLQFERMVQFQQRLAEVKFQAITTREDMSAVPLDVPAVTIVGKLAEIWTPANDKSLLLSYHLFGEVSDDPRFEFPTDLPSKAQLQKRFHSLIAAMFRTETKRKRRKVEKSQETEWSSMEKSKFSKIILVRTLPVDEEGWIKFAIEFSRSAEDVRAYSERFLALCKEVLDEKQNKAKEESSTADKPHISAARAQKVLDRQELLASVQAVMQTPEVPC